MWIYANTAETELPKLPAAQKARKRLPHKWYRRAYRKAETAGRESARKMGVPYMFDMAAAERSMSAFVGEHAPDSMPVRPDASDYEICMKARTLANDVVLRALGLDVYQALIVATRTCAAYG
ncbi:MAG: replication endonuclease, partial [Paraburkholderia sp.]